MATIDTYAPVTDHQILGFDSGVIAPGDHTVKLQVSGSRNSESTGNNCYFDHLLYMPALSNEVDGNDSAWNYTGTWEEERSRRGYDQTVMVSNTSGDTASYTFTGDRVQLFTQRSPCAGKFDIAIDDKVVATYDGYSPSGQYQALAFASERLIPGEHTITITVRSDSHPNAFDSWVYVDFIGFDETLPLGYIIDSLHYDVTSAGWQYEVHADAYWNWTYKSNTSGTFASYAFEGSGIKVVSRTGPASGECTVEIDDAAVATVDTYSATTNHRAVIYEDQSLTRGEHKVDLVVAGT